MHPYLDTEKDLEYIETTEIGAIFAYCIPLSVKFNITSARIELLNVKVVFIGLPSDDANIKLTNTLRICTSNAIHTVNQYTEYQVETILFDF